MNAYISPGCPASQQTSCYVLLTPQTSPPTAVWLHQTFPTLAVTVIRSLHTNTGREVYFYLNEDSRLPLGDLLSTCYSLVGYQKLPLIYSINQTKY